jgi:hypothetical protein
MQLLPLIFSIVALVAFSTIFINLCHPQLKFGDIGGKQIHGIHSMTNGIHPQDSSIFPELPVAVVRPIERPIVTTTTEKETHQALPPLHEEHEPTLTEEGGGAVVEVVKYQVSGEEVVHYDDTHYLAYLQKSKNTFQNHAGHALLQQTDLSLEDYMLQLSKQDHCATRPIFMSMARVSSDLYWHLIENFFYTMYYFDNLVSRESG